MDFKKERVNFHNNFPETILFKAEIQFNEKLKKANGIIPFVPVKLGYDNDPLFQTYVGHLVDGMGSLPFRPDYMFDHCFKVIDDGGSKFFPKKGIKGVVQGLGNELLKQSKRDWECIVNSLGKYIPLMTCRFITKRLCEAYYLKDLNSKALSDRASKCFGVAFYNEFIQRFALDDNGKQTGIISTERIEKGGSFLKLYLSGNKATKRNGKASGQFLDLTKDCNIPTANQRIELLLSLLLFNMRNERSHGAVLSPFRTSKSSIERYQSYYFAMLCSYTFCLGVLSLSNYALLNSDKIKLCVDDNIDLQKVFFK